MATDMIELGATLEYYGGICVMGKHGREIIAADDVAVGNIGEGQFFLGDVDLGKLLLGWHGSIP